MFSKGLSSQRGIVASELARLSGSSLVTKRQPRILEVSSNVAPSRSDNLRITCLEEQPIAATKQPCRDRAMRVYPHYSVKY